MFWNVFRNVILAHVNTANYFYSALALSSLFINPSSVQIQFVLIRGFYFFFFFFCM